MSFSSNHDVIGFNKLEQLKQPWRVATQEPISSTTTHFLNPRLDEYTLPGIVQLTQSTPLKISRICLLEVKENPNQSPIEKSGNLVLQKNNI